MSEADDRQAMAHWLKTVQGTDLDLAGIMPPTRTGSTTAQLLDELGAGRTFDTEPARYYKLLRELAPGPKTP